MGKLFKYSSVQTAIEIVGKGRVLLKSPLSFNDPFDSLLDISKKDEKRCEDLITNYYFFIALCEFVEGKDINSRKKGKAIFIFLKAVIKIYKVLITKTKKYHLCSFLNTAIKLLKIQSDKINEATVHVNNNYEKIIESYIKPLRRESRISCFSERNDSILMWSHYASSHTGVCIEFEEDRKAFRRVKYSDKKEYLDIYDAVSRILASDLTGKKLNLNEKKLVEKLLNPFFSKAKDWSYEQEIRCVFYKEDLDKPGIIFDDMNYYIEMNISKIYIGAKASNESINKLLIIAKNKEIPVVFMKEDSESYSIVPDINKIPNIDYSQSKRKNCVENLFEEMNKALNSECYISAMSIALSIPGIIGQVAYSKLSYKEAYIKWYQEVMGFAEKSPDHLDEAYPSGDLCYELKEAMQNNGNSDIKGKYEEFILTDFALKFEKKKNFEIYSSEIISGTEMNGDKVNKLELNVRDFCYKLEACSKKSMKTFKNQLDDLPIISVDDFTESANYIIK